MPEKSKTCFIIMPITTPDTFVDKYRDGADHFKHVLDCLFVPCIEEAGYKAIPPTAKGADLIHAEIIRNLEQADLVLCDMSCLNPNVFFEFGIRTSLNKPVCVVKDELTKRVPFDTGILNHQEYKSTLNPWELREEIQKLGEHIKAAEERSKGENMLWKYFGLRNEAQPYAGETGTDAKIDYLTMQMDSLRQQVGGLLQNSEKPVPQTKGARLDEDFASEIAHSVISFLPEGIRPVTFDGDIKQGFELTYKGLLNRRMRTMISRKIHDAYGIILRLRPFEHPDSARSELEE